MKKRIFAFVLAACMVFLLCGCDALEELRQQRAEYEWKDIVYQGVTYKKLPICPALNPEVDYERPVYVTEPDVPLLLITTHATAYFYRSQDGNFLLHDSSEAVFCREDMYDQIESVILKGWEYTKVYYEYSVYTQDDPWGYEERRYMLTQEQTEALEFLVANVEPQILSDGMYLQSDYSVELTECSEDELFCRTRSRIAAAGNTYYLILEERQAFQVPDGMVSVFDDITEAYRTAYYVDEEFDQYA